MHSDHGLTGRDFPMFRAGSLLLLSIGLFAFAADRLDRGRLSPDGASALPAGPGAADLVAPRFAPAAPFRAALLAHWEALAPVLPELQEAQEGRDVVRLVTLRERIVRAVEDVPELPAAVTEAEREIRASYRQALLDLEDGIDDLHEGLLEQDRIEWEEGRSDIRIARTRLDAVLARLDRMP